MYRLIFIILSTIFVSLFSLVGVFALAIQNKTLQKIVSYLVAFSIGGLLAGAFFHILPEAEEIIGLQTSLTFVLVGILLFFIVEKVFHWRHCHKENCEIHSFAYVNLLGDSIHNFFDGVIIAGSFLVNFHVGLATTLAIMVHEIPQEIGDFGVLVHAGFSKRKALVANLLTALLAVLGGVMGYFLFAKISAVIPYLLALTAGGFVYLASSDLIPEIIKEKSLRKSFLQIIIISLGILIMYTLKFLE